MRPEGIRKALLEAEAAGKPATVHLNDGTRLRVASREHWLVGPEYLYIVSGREVHLVAFRNVASVAIRARRRSG